MHPSSDGSKRGVEDFPKEPARATSWRWVTCRQPSRCRSLKRGLLWRTYRRCADSAPSGYRADDLEAAKKWYSDLLGIEPYFERAGYAEFRLGDYHHELGLIDSRYSPGVPATGQAGSVTYWLVDDRAATLSKLVSMGGAKEYESMQDRGQGFITASVVDPFGNILGIMYNPHYLEVLNAMKK
jgi:predicted enzyme related to lactoylglutathione lyase